MNETKTETPTQPAAPTKAAVKPNENKKSEVKPPVAGAGKVQELPVQAQPAPAKVSDQGRTIPASVGAVPEKEVETKPGLQINLKDFDNWLKLVPKEWLPTMMVRIANKCLAEKVFATPGAMAEAIVGASKK